MTIYVDMDGVLAKWDTSATPEDTKKEGYFLDREPEKIIVSLVKSMLKLGINVSILSAVWNKKAAMDKSKWLDKYIGKDLARIFVPYGEDKSDYISGGSGNVLIDDYTPNLNAWKESGNIPIKFYNGINGTKGTYNGLYITKDMSIGDIFNVITNI